VIERFSTHARAALAAAEREARSLKHAQIGTEHVLLGLLRVEGCVAARALRLMGVSYRKARRRIAALVDVGPAKVTPPLAFTPRVREVLEDALTGAVWSQRLGESIGACGFEQRQPLGRPRLDVRSEQVLLALIAHGDGVAAHVLGELGVDLEKAATATTHVRFPLPTLELFSSGTWPPKLP
jgi:ATP-dependent Clp protease ATP-binding subunit ClpC